MREVRGPKFGPQCEIVEVRILEDISEISSSELEKMPPGLDSIDILLKRGWTQGAKLEVITLRVL